MIPLLLIAAAPPAAFPAATPTSIEDVRRDPRAWDGKWVELRGWINSCMSADCVLAERLATRRANQGMSLSFEGQRTFDEWAKPMLPARVRVVARIDATCLIDLCTDRAPVLRQMHVEALETNRKFPDEEQ